MNKFLHLTNYTRNIREKQKIISITSYKFTKNVWVKQNIKSTQFDKKYKRQGLDAVKQKETSA